MREPWRPQESPDEEAARQEAYRRLSDAARRIGLPLERLGALLARVADNERETRRFLAERVYQVTDAELDELLRRRIADLRADDSDA
ncbi:MAG TPA: hypothetical protein VFL93_09540 [Longimicrobiaceae bacterium]|jgi:hypothetical protein|nr:hypothetical protein [Longimicrobiaceae bacterium]